MLRNIVSVKIKKKYIDRYEHVNHARYQDIFEYAQVVILKENNVVLDDFKLTHNIRFVQRLFLIEFIKPLFLNDQVDVQTIISKIGSTSFIFTQKIIKNKQIVTKAKTVYVSINNSGSKTLLPDIFHNLRAGNRSRRCNHVRW